jgi:tetratricopeptide (TPR) repeat protein
MTTSIRFTGLASIAALALLTQPISAQTPSAPPADPAVARADSLYRQQQWSEAAGAYRALAARSAEQGMFWYRLGIAEHMQGHYAPAEAAFDKATRFTAPGPASRGASWYNLASARARLAKADGAFQALDSAIAAGFVGPKTIAQDPDFASLLTDPRMVQRQEQVRLAFFPCDTMPAARQFDFWIGDWDVYTPAKQLAGTNSVQKILGGCVLLENWEGSLGGSGKSMNWYNVQAGYWQQTWVASGASQQEYREGRLDGNTLRFLGERMTPQGKLNVRLSFTPLAPNRVRQHAENSADGGATWTTVYDFLYLRQGSGEKP